jgi:hypothetical protein
MPPDEEQSRFVSVLVPGEDDDLFRARLDVPAGGP